MLFLLFITSGLFLGWSLGANDAANVFGTAVGSRMIKFRKAAIIASLFVILGAVLQGTGATETLSSLGSIDAMGGAFTVALCSAIVVTWMTYYKLPVSTSQAIVGAIIGWCFYTSNPVDYKVLTVIAVSWFTGPLLGAIFSGLLYLLMRYYMRRTKTHVLILDSHIRNGLLIVGAFAAFSLGANNVSNVMGVFVNSTSFHINAGPFTFTNTHVLFLLGGLSIAAGILTYSKKVINTVGHGLLEMTPETAIVVVLSQALVLFIFSSTALSDLFVRIGLPAIPLVPVSSTQVIVGALIGIGAIKGIQEIRFKMLGTIMLGWLMTPVLAGLLTFISLFFVNNVFKIDITHKQLTVVTSPAAGPTTTVINLPVNTVLISVTAIALAVMGITAYLYFRHYRSKTAAREYNTRLNEQLQYAELQKSLSEIEIKQVQVENSSLHNRLEEKRKELVNYALNIADQRQFLELTCAALEECCRESDPQKKNSQIREVIRSVKQKMSFTDEIEQIYQQAEHVNDEFPSRLTELSPHLSAQERKLALLLRVGFSSKEIAPLLNISTKSVEIARYRLRKKFDLKKEINLTQFIKTI
ncbi:MAG TPA: inorganic phosphate transporter [Chitinophagaceae bacterium]|nr:inorganic phosphate transporter [Chitinophagaceae bacterium]HPH32473.1 inorganic phosphate transporter [Chitinophagaceae bacterium]HPN58602.1 inorganic phosphate transporter [Chitinophagaceae bacterium]HRG23570.1 inorganic phosphate transporter [Chitinophagaceae bacterium]